MWTLQKDDDPDTVFRIMPGSVRTIGRATGADFILDAALVSRVHCRLTSLPDGGLEIQDLGSTNGTFLNGRRVRAARIAHGDRLRVGRVQLVAKRGRGNHAPKSSPAPAAVTDPGTRE